MRGSGGGRLGCGPRPDQAQAPLILLAVLCATTTLPATQGSSYPLELLTSVLGFNPQCTGDWPTWSYRSDTAYTRTTSFPTPSYTALSTLVGPFQAAPHDVIQRLLVG